ncbi:MULTISPECIES: primosomal protein DnaI [Bacillaceae]|uniref:Primosomal protein DnaI n=1 Tax=Evansella alkalicola TaxID=745819 RepID=A0ABS6JRH1_9BACI|nr:primosomal protein DnaI [Litchfieldia alkalitelluris]MBU9721163.1 primosomal protein DnaI [Bacillus alkalicola]
MDSIGKTLRNMPGGKFEERLKQISADMLKDQRIQSFLTKHAVTEKQIDKGMNELFQYKTQWDNCDSCTGLESCPNVMKGYQPQLSIYRNDFQLEYQICPLMKKVENNRRQASLIQSLYIPKEMTSATFEDVHEDTPSRIEAIVKAMEFTVNVNPGENGQGLYIYGPFGVGKTFLMGAIANELAERDIQTMIVYTPDFFRELKNGIQDGSYQKKLDQVKRSPVLILDDIGAETMSNWVRDDILGTLLQFRMMEKLPTLFTSNYDLDELENHLAYTHRGGLEKLDQLKAKRIMERIRYLNTVIDMKGENKRA